MDPMENDEPNTSQLRSEDGKLVETDDEQNSESERAADPVMLGEDTGYAVDVKSGALDVNGRLREVVETRGHTLAFGSRSQAEDYAHQLSATDGAVKIQAAAQNEPKEVDAYLLADHNPSIEEPAEIDGDTWTFDVGTNLYGSLGEAILVYSHKPHALVYFVRQDLDINDEELEWGLTVDVEPAKPLSIDHAGERKRWTPDCVVKAKDGWREQILETYYCEIKTGNASFERSQVKTMELMAEDDRVLKIRVDIDSLPDQYSLRIHEMKVPE